METTDTTLRFLLGYLRPTQWTSALREAKTDSSIDPEKVRQLMKVQDDAYSLETDLIEQMVEDDELFREQMKQDKV